MYTSPYSENATGYEPKPDARLAFTQPLKRLQISDAQLKVLPAFGYDGKQRQDFADGFKKLLSTWRLVWMVKNEPAIPQVSQNDRGVAQVGPSPTFFSPRDQRGRVGPGVRGDDLRPDPRGMASASHASVKQAEGFSPHYVGPPGQYDTRVNYPPSGAYMNPPSGAYMNPPSRAYMNPPSGAYVPWGAQQFPPSGAYQPSINSDFPESGASDFLQERKYGRPGCSVHIDVASSQRTDNNDFDQDILDHECEDDQQNQPEQQPEPQPQMSEEDLENQRNEIAKAKTEADRIFDRQQMANASAQMQRQMAKFAEMQTLQHQQMQAQYEAQNQILRQQMHHMQTALQKSNLLTTTGVETWVIDEEICVDFPEPAKWRWPLNSEGRGRLEDDWEQNIRSRMWVYLTSIIPKPMWSSLVELDIKGIYIALRSVNRANAITEGTELRVKLSQLSKKDKPMMPWLDDLWSCMDDLDKLRQPVSVEQVRQIIFAAVKDDKRYADFKRDFSRNPEMDINTMKAHLLEAARDCDDLVGESKVSKRALKAAAKAAAASATQAGGKGGTGGKGGKGDRQIAHPSPSTGAATTATAAAQGSVPSRDNRDKASKQLCQQFLYGSCRRGDTCHYMHVDLSKVVEEAAKREKQRKEQSDQKGDGKVRDKSKEGKSATPNPKSDKMKICNQFRANGTCEYGDNCIFEHVTPGQKGKACRVKRQSPDGLLTNWMWISKTRSQIRLLNWPSNWVW